MNSRHSLTDLIYVLSGGKNYTQMEYHPIDVLQVNDIDLIDFDAFITKQEDRRVGYNDGVFKVILKAWCSSPVTIFISVCKF